MLNVGHNQLTTLQGIGNCTNLKVLIANNNSLTELRVPAKLLELNTIVASHNLIETVENLQPFVSLKKLSLQNNKLRIAPDLRKNVMLSELRLNSNKISSLPPTLALNAQLSVLDLAHNHLSDVTVLWELPRLSSLHLAGWAGHPGWAQQCRLFSHAQCVRPPALCVLADNDSALGDYAAEAKERLKKLEVLDGKKVYQYKGDSVSCYRCGGSHFARDCTACVPSGGVIPKRAKVGLAQDEKAPKAPKAHSRVGSEDAPADRPKSKHTSTLDDAERPRKKVKPQAGLATDRPARPKAPEHTDRVSAKDAPRAQLDFGQAASAMLADASAVVATVRTNGEHEARKKKPKTRPVLADSELVDDAVDVATLLVQGSTKEPKRSSKAQSGVLKTAKLKERRSTGTEGDVFSALSVDFGTGGSSAW